MSLQYNYNKSGSERKALVQAVSGILGELAVYQGAPTFSYAIGGCSVDKNGILSIPEEMGPERLDCLISGLQEQGFAADNTPEENASTEENTAETAVEADTESVADEDAETTAGNTVAVATNNSDGDNTLTIEMPKTGFTDASLDNLQKIVASKESLLKKALGTDAVAIIDTGETLKFPWFTLQNLEGEADAYSRLVAAICNMAQNRKRVVAKEHDTENDKFTMRLFLVQLGFIGDEYKPARKILLRNLTGNSSWKSGHAPVRPAPATEATAAASNPEPEKEGGGPDGK